MVDQTVQRYRAFSDDHRLLTHSGIYPAGIVVEPPRLSELGEYLDPHVPDDALQDYAKVAALGPLREHEDQIARRLFADQENAQNHPDLGWHLGTYSGYMNDTEQRLESSSGGIATAVLVELLESGRIDGVIHLRANSAPPYFEYAVSTTPEQVRAGRKTRYYPASLATSLDHVRLNGGRYAVVAIPSFMSELRRLEMLEPALRDSIRYHIGLICGHQKSANYALNLAWQCGISPNDLAAIDFRVKIPDRPANDYGTRFVYRTDPHGNTAEKVVPQRDLYGTNWGWGMFKSSFSDYTDDAFNETADLVLGDAWLPQFTHDSSGTNVVVVRDQELGKVLTSLNNRGEISLSALDPAQIARSQTSLIRHTRREIGYRMTWINGSRPLPEMRRLPSADIPLGRKLIQRQRYRIATKSHTAFVQALNEGDWGRFRRAMSPLTTTYRIIDKAQHAFAR